MNDLLYIYGTVVTILFLIFLRFICCINVRFTH
jgi:hypothetical protein